MLKSLKAIAFAAIVAVAVPALADGEHGGDFIVGRTSSGQLALENIPDEPLHLELSGNQILFPGWSSTEPGFDSLNDDEPGEDFYTMATGADIWLELVSVGVDDGGLKVINQTLTSVLDAPGESFLLGGPSLHTHVFWHLDSTVLGGGFAGTRSATFRLVDNGGTGYAASDPFTLQFTNVEVPEPATLGLLAVGGGTLLLRLRRRHRA